MVMVLFDAIRLNFLIILFLDHQGILCIALNLFPSYSIKISWSLSGSMLNSGSYEFTSFTSVGYGWMQLRTSL